MLGFEIGSGIRHFESRVILIDNLLSNSPMQPCISILPHQFSLLLLQELQILSRPVLMWLLRIIEHRVSSKEELTQGAVLEAPFHLRHQI